MTDLAKKMRAKADEDRLPPDHELRVTADAFDITAAGFYASGQTKTVQQFMGTWARARKCWCDYSGEQLI